MKSYLLDTNVFLRYILADIPKQTIEARTYFAQAKRREITLTLPLLLFVEAVFTLSKFYSVPKEDIVNKLQAMGKISYLDIEKREIVLNALSLYKTSTVSFIDACLLQEAIRSKKTLLTFDKKLRSLSKDF